MIDKRIAAALVIAAALLSVSAFAQNQNPTDQATIDHAAATVAQIHDGMLNPPTFVLDRVFIAKLTKRGRSAHVPSICYEYRSQNTTGGMSAGLSVEDAGSPARTFNADFLCQPKNIERNITKEVAAAAPALYRKDK